MSTTCIQCGDELINCSKCGIKCVRNGFSKAGKQRYKCQICCRTRVIYYSYKAYVHGVDEKLVKLLKDSVGIRGIGRLLGISPSTVQRRMLRIARNISKPTGVMNMSYEMDEMCTYIGSKSNRIWIAYAIRKDTKSVVDFSIGRRTNKTLKKVIETLIRSQARRIYTDKLFKL